MSNPAPKSPQVKEHVNDTGRQIQEESLELQLGAIDLNDPESTNESQQPRRIKLSARDLIGKLSRRRLELTRINFTTGGSPAGRGSHGEVVVATLTLDDGSSSESENQVAVKKFLFSDNIDEERFLRTFANELRVLDGLDHPNIIKLVGFVEDMEKRVAWLVFPWEANGNVREFLRSGKWEPPERVSLIKDAASGLKYLHSREPPIRHGDLKSLNILVNAHHRALITDFGSARIQSEARGFQTLSGSPRLQEASANSNLTPHDGSPEVTVSVTNAELTLTGPSWSFRWAAPEILNEEEPSLASDIWALGWIAWEVITDNYPFPEAKTNGLITVKVIKGLLPLLHEDDQVSQIGRLCHLMVRCWKSEPKERPSAAECLSALRWISSTVPRTRSDGTSQIRSAALLVQMGDMHRLRGRHKEALQLFEEGIAMAQSTGEKALMARALMFTGESHRMLLNYEKAQESCSQALAIYTDIGKRSGQANALHTLGNVYQARYDYVKAEESFNQALAIYTGAGNSLGRANALRRLGETHQSRSNLAKAEEYLSQSLVISTSIGHGSCRLNALQKLGEIHQERSNHAEAEKFFSQALATSTDIGSNLGRANSLIGLGEALFSQARYPEAKSFLEDATQVSNQIKYKWGQIRARSFLNDVLGAEESSTAPTL